MPMPLPEQDVEYDFAEHGMTLVYEGENCGDLNCCIYFNIVSMDDRGSNYYYVVGGTGEFAMSWRNGLITEISRTTMYDTIMEATNA